MAKDINIHVKTQGTGQSAQNLDKVGKAGKRVGSDINEGQKRAGKATNDTTQKMSKMGGILGTLKGQVMGFLGAWLGVNTVLKGLSMWIQKLERIGQIQKDVADQQRSLIDIGQALEFQTGTVGQQKEWAQKAVEVQKAGGLSDTATAGKMLVAADIVFKESLGGIESPEVIELVKQLAPFVGAAGFGADDVSKLFKLAGTVGVEPTAEAYKDFFAELHAAYTASESSDPGQFLQGAQKGITAYMAMGGSFKEGLSTYSAAIKMTANESLAANLLEQISRLSSGAYEKPTSAIEESLDVEWSKLEMDERKAALIEHTRRIPEGQRGAVMAEQGFPAELITQVSKMVSPKAREVLVATRQKVAEAKGVTIDKMTESYLETEPAKARQVEAKKAERTLEVPDSVSEFQRRYDDSEDIFEKRVIQGQDEFQKDSIEPITIALRKITDEIDRTITELPAGELRQEAEALRTDIHAQAKNLGSSMSYLRSEAAQKIKAYRNLDRWARLRDRISQEYPGLEVPAGKDITIEDTRALGEQARKEFRDSQPKRQWFREIALFGDDAERREAAQRKWRESLKDEDREFIEKDLGIYPGLMWHRMSEAERYESLTGGPRIPLRVRPVPTGTLDPPTRTPDSPSVTEPPSGTEGGTGGYAPPPVEPDVKSDERRATSDAAFRQVNTSDERRETSDDLPEPDVPKTELEVPQVETELATHEAEAVTRDTGPGTRATSDAAFRQVNTSDERRATSAAAFRQVNTSDERQATSDAAFRQINTSDERRATSDDLPEPDVPKTELEVPQVEVELVTHEAEAVTRDTGPGTRETSDAAFRQQPQQVVHHHIHHNYKIDNSTRYYPQFGEDDRGPRVP